MLSGFRLLLCRSAAASTTGTAARLWGAGARCSYAAEAAPAAAPPASEQDEFREYVRDFAQKQIAPYAEQVDKTNSFPQNVDVWRELGSFGLLGVTAPQQYGGLELGYAKHCIAMEELSRASGSIGLSYGAHSNLCVSQIVRNGTRAQMEHFLPKLISDRQVSGAFNVPLLQQGNGLIQWQDLGEHIGALSISEPGSGSDAVSLRTRADRKKDHFVLNGTKMWCTNGPKANVVIVYAKTQPDKGPHGITAFLVEKGMRGYTTAQKLDKLGMRGSDTCELIFENCEVPVENVLGAVDGGVRVLMSGLDYERLVLSAGPVGLMQACLDAAVPYAATRKQFGQPIGSFQLIQGKLADMYAATGASRAYVQHLAQEADAGRTSRKDCASVILYTAERATQVALDAIQVLGGNGYINDYPTGRFLRDAKLYEIGAGTSEIRRMLVGRELLKQYLGNDT